MDVTIIAAIIGVGGAVIGGWVGGKIATTGAVDAALRGAQKAHDDNIRRDEGARLAEVIAVGQAVRSELEVMWQLSEKQIAPAVRRISSGKPLVTRFVLNGAVFPVYDANAALLGRIDDANVRASIVRAYAFARSFVDTIAMNNRLVDKLESLSGTSGADRQAAWIALDEYGRLVVDAHQNLEAQYGDVMQRTGDWLDKNGQPWKPPTQGIAPISI